MGVVMVDAEILNRMKVMIADEERAIFEAPPAECGERRGSVSPHGMKAALAEWVQKFIHQYIAVEHKCCVPGGAGKAPVGEFAAERARGEVYVCPECGQMWADVT